MPIKKGRQLINYTEYFFELVDLVNKKKPFNKIKTLGLGDCYYNVDNEVIRYKNKKIEILNNRYLGGSFDSVDNHYERYARPFFMKNESKNTTLILSRVGEHLFDFHHQLYDIYTSGIADSVVMLLPDMSEVVENIEPNIKKCKSNNCLDFDFERNMIELLSCCDNVAGSILDLHRVYTSPNTIETLLYPCISTHMFKNIEILECDKYINGYKHFILFIEFDGTTKCNFNSVSDIPNFSFYSNGLDDNGIFLSSRNIIEKVDDCLDIEAICEKKYYTKDFDTIIFNKILSKSDMINTYYLYNICKYIKPNTNIIIIEDNMLNIVKDIESKNIDFNNFWYLNSLLYGPSFQAIPENYEHINFCNKFFMTPDVLNIMMTQECLYEETPNYGNEHFISSIGLNKYTFIRSYMRI